MAASRKLHTLLAVSIGAAVARNDDILEAILYALHKDNPKFDRDKFLGTMAKAVLAVSSTVPSTTPPTSSGE